MPTAAMVMICVLMDLPVMGVNAVVSAAANAMASAATAANVVSAATALLVKAGVVPLAMTITRN